MLVIDANNQLVDRTGEVLETVYTPLNSGTNTCKVTNALREAYYEIRYVPTIDYAFNSENFGYMINKASVDILL